MEKPIQHFLVYGNHLTSCNLNQVSSNTLGCTCGFTSAIFSIYDDKQPSDLTKTFCIEHQKNSCECMFKFKDSPGHEVT